MPVDADAILSLAVDLATQAAAVHSAGRGTLLRIEEKGSPFSLVTQVDREAERVIVDGITAARPDDEILGEEGTSVSGSSGVRWLVDPVDGTTNYVYGYAAYSASIGVEIDGQPAVGVVFDTGRDVLYTAVRGRGATANGDPIESSDKDELATALVATGFAFDPAASDTAGRDADEDPGAGSRHPAERLGVDRPPFVGYRGRRRVLRRRARAVGRRGWSRHRRGGRRDGASVYRRWLSGDRRDRRQPSAARTAHRSAPRRRLRTRRSGSLAKADRRDDVRSAVDRAGLGARGHFPGEEAIP